MKKLIVIALAIWGYWHFFAQGGSQHPLGILIADAPKQEKIYRPVSFSYNGYTISPQAEFSLNARVLSKKNYRKGVGREADVSHVDLALGWQEMSDSTVLEYLKITQSSRRYYWRYQEFPFAANIIPQKSANMHLVAANDYVKKQLSNIKKHDLIFLQGKLINIKADDGWYWKSSLTRNDRGDGSCELIYVEQVDILKK